MGDQQVPDFIAALDQLSSSLIDIAKALASYHMALVGCGVTEGAATAPSVDMQHILILGAQDQGGEA